METKICTNCGIEKSVNEYHQDNSRPGKHQSWCKECSTNRNTEQVKEGRKQYYKRLSERQGAFLKTYMQFLKDNSYLPKREEIPNYDKATVSGLIYALNKKNIPVPTDSGRKGAGSYNWKGGVAQYQNHSTFKKQRLKVLDVTNSKCALCETPAEHVHHIDGTTNNHELKNLIPLCNKCHKRIHAEANGHKKGKSKYKDKYGFTLQEISKELNVSISTLTSWEKQKDKHVAKILTMLRFWELLENEIYTD